MKITMTDDNGYCMYISSRGNERRCPNCKEIKEIWEKIK